VVALLSGWRLLIMVLLHGLRSGDGHVPLGVFDTCTGFWFGASMSAPAVSYFLVLYLLTTCTLFPIPRALGQGSAREESAGDTLAMHT
jgi:hypothetical protein